MRLALEVLRYATVLTALCAMIFGILQVKQWQRARNLNVALELVHTIRSPEFTRCIARILQLPPDVASGRVAEDSELVNAAFTVSHAFESLGLLVFYRMLPLQFVDHLVGGYAAASWRRLAPYLHERRTIDGPSVAEWYQWLVERLSERSRAPENALGAAVVFRDWHE